MKQCINFPAKAMISVTIVTNFCYQKIEVDEKDIGETEFVVLDGLR